MRTHIHAHAQPLAAHAAGKSECSNASCNSRSRRCSAVVCGMPRTQCTDKHLCGGRRGAAGDSGIGYDPHPVQHTLPKESMQDRSALTPTHRQLAAVNRSSTCCIAGSRTNNCMPLPAPGAPFQQQQQQQTGYSVRTGNAALWQRIAVTLLQHTVAAGESTHQLNNWHASLCATAYGHTHNI